MLKLKNETRQKMLKPTLLAVSLLVGSLTATASQAKSKLIDEIISFEQLKRDVSYLADDKLKGRASFTPQSEQAADYIAKRFRQMGLKPLDGLNSFKQTFDIFQISNKSIVLSLNNKAVENHNVLVLSHHEQFEWKTADNLAVGIIKKEDDFRKQFRQANLQSSNQIVLIDRAHEAMFERYKKYFSQAKNSFKLNQGPSAIFVLTDQTQVIAIKANAVANVEKHSLTNVVGVLEGQQKADEMLLFSAHYDHMPPQKNKASDKQTNHDLIYNGADDNASGTAGIINIAEHFSKTKGNQRSLVFVAFAAEEIGGYGSQYFSKQVAADKITAMINLEMIGKVSKFGQGGVWMTGYERSDLARILNANLTAKNKSIHPDPYPKQQLFYRSDNATLARLGVPAHSFSASQIDIDHHYHQTSDQVDTLDIKSMQMLLSTLVESMSSLVDGSDTPTRIDTSEVKGKGQYF
jgi:aminopeptidase YwaD